MTLAIMSLINLGGVPSLGSSMDDKIYHFVAYALFTAIWYKAISRYNINHKYVVLISIAIAFGMVIEVLQSVLTDYRVSDVYDILANTLGVLCSVGAIGVYEKREA
ncbi:MAG: hypothetical protein BM564_06930 [Bacteroidetes bacterium MedPE-SWsnd-G2]|nr:MAG: hypothetical protein BM564_06930 [Bacteroidetes bacterium MedPE-SWsnd-G2]